MTRTVGGAVIHGLPDEVCYVTPNALGSFNVRVVSGVTRSGPWWRRCWQPTVIIPVVDIVEVLTPCCRRRADAENQANLFAAQLAHDQEFIKILDSAVEQGIDQGRIVIHEP